MSTDPTRSQLRHAVLLVALLNLAYFAVEFSAAISIASVSLFADSIDFLEDASVNLLIVLALGWSLAARARLGMGLAAILLVPSLAALWEIWQKFSAPIVPEATALSLVGTGALVVNLGCAFLLTRFRKAEGSLTKAAFLSARNDVVINLSIIAMAALTAATGSGWPDLVLGCFIIALALHAAYEVW